MIKMTLMIVAMFGAYVLATHIGDNLGSEIKDEINLRKERKILKRIEKENN